MPDFDEFERIFKASLTNGGDVKEAALAICALPEINKVKVVKNKSLGEIEGFLRRARQSLSDFFPVNCDFVSSANNKHGKDLLETMSGMEIELKSGSEMTDANSGLKTVSWAIEDEPGEIEKIMNRGKEERRILALADVSREVIEESKARTMDELAACFREKLKIGPAPEKLTHYLKCVSVGITNGQEIVNLYPQREERFSTPLLLEADWESGLKLYEKSFLPNEQLLVTQVERTDSRVHVIAEGADSARRAKIYPNYKNSWSAGGKKFSASYWVNNPCFHVWID